MAKIERDQLVIFVIKVSTLIILCLMLLHTLNVSGQPRTIRKSIAQINNKQEEVRRIYTSQIGVREKSYNAGVAVERYLRYVHLSKGNPWCAAFVCWAYGEAGVENPRSGWSPDLFASKRLIWRREASPVSGIKNQESRLGGGVSYTARYLADGITPAVRRGYATSQASVAGPQTSIKPSISFNLPTPTSDLRPQTSGLRPQTADVFGLYFPEKRRIAHVGFVDQWDGTWMISVEGNTNIAGSREGDGVYRKRRLVKSVYQVARYINH